MHFYPEKESWVENMLTAWHETQQKLGIPLYIGEFGDVATRSIMETSMTRFNEYGWPWTIATYKNVQNVLPEAGVWCAALYGFRGEWVKVNLYEDTEVELTAAFGRYQVGNFGIYQDWAGLLQTYGAP
ncbi:MAG: hypothetical protein HY897_11095 [Deltaproteobacteria bacterium]|nr:hypothetical protein [Deltaproteobacteria bacterium]